MVGSWRQCRVAVWVKCDICKSSFAAPKSAIQLQEVTNARS